MINKMTDFKEIQARAILENVPFLKDDSFSNLIFSWLQLAYKNNQKKKKSLLLHSLNLKTAKFLNTSLIEMVYFQNKKSNLLH